MMKGQDVVNPAKDTTLDSPIRNEKPRRFVRTGLLLMASAAFGGLAMALWDRHTLSRIRNRAEPAPDVRPPDDEDAIY